MGFLFKRISFFLLNCRLGKGWQKPFSIPKPPYYTNRLKKEYKCVSSIYCYDTCKEDNSSHGDSIYLPDNIMLNETFLFESPNEEFFFKFCDWTHLYFQPTKRKVCFPLWILISSRCMKATEIYHASARVESNECQKNAKMACYTTCLKWLEEPDKREP
jgi:hypothetical protein